MIQSLLLVASGGAIGATLRYLSGLLIQRVPSGELPLGTFFVNVVGCFLIGVLAGAAETRSFFTGDTRLFLVVGILGGFTTFSSFGFEAFELIRRGHAMLAMLHVTGQCVLGIGAVAAGYRLLRAG
jgi:fluoride exporter